MKILRTPRGFEITSIINKKKTKQCAFTVLDNKSRSLNILHKLPFLYPFMRTQNNTNACRLRVIQDGVSEDGAG